MIRKLLILISSFTLLLSPLSAEEAPAEAAEALALLMDATQENDIEKFRSCFHEDLGQNITPTMLEQVYTQIADNMKKGYQSIYLGLLDRETVQTHLWKIDFDSDGVADLLAELTYIDGNVSGFLIR